MRREAALARDAAVEPSEITARLKECRLCALRFAATETQHTPRPIFQLDPRARLLIASQAPGMRAHRSGLPFDDPSGDRLRAWLGVGRDIFYDASRIAIVPMGFCFPGYDAKGSDLPPPPLCAETWREAMLGLLPNIGLTLAIGQYAQRWHLGRAPKGGLTARVAAWRESPAGILPLPHPSWRNTAWLKRNPWFEADVLPELRARVAALVR
ncbi:MAG: uracil-DNA glycosylase family protein [Pseudomonadota bacterium]